MHRMALPVDIAALLDERGRAICDALRGLLRLLLRITGRDERAIEP